MSGSVCGLSRLSAWGIVLRGPSVVCFGFGHWPLYYGARPWSAQCLRPGHCTTGSHEVCLLSFLGLWSGTDEEVLWMRVQSFASHLDLIVVVDNGMGELMDLKLSWVCYKNALQTFRFVSPSLGSNRLSFQWATYYFSISAASNTIFWQYRSTREHARARRANFWQLPSKECCTR